MKRQRGLLSEIQIIAIIVAAAALVGGAFWLHHSIKEAGREEGRAEVQGKWDAANRKAQEAADRLHAQNEADRRALLARALEAESNAAHWQTEWEKEHAKAKRAGKPLGVCQPANPVGTGAADGGAVRGGGGDRINATWQFVGLWDSAWTGKDGQPVFGDSPRIIAAAGATDPAQSSGLTLDDILTNHQANAARCDTIRRDYNALIDRVELLRKRWDDANPPQ